MDVCPIIKEQQHFINWATGFGHPVFHASNGPFKINNLHAESSLWSLHMNFMESSFGKFHAFQIELPQV